MGKIKRFRIGPDSCGQEHPAGELVLYVDHYSAMARAAQMATGFVSLLFTAAEYQERGARNLRSCAEDCARKLNMQEQADPPAPPGPAPYAPGEAGQIKSTLLGPAGDVPSSVRYRQEKGTMLQDDVMGRWVPLDDHCREVGAYRIRLQGLRTAAKRLAEIAEAAEQNLIRAQEAHAVLQLRADRMKEELLRHGCRTESRGGSPCRECVICELHREADL